MSHLLQMRGLKPARKLWACRERKVASFTDAWIETEKIVPTLTDAGRIFYRCVD